MKVPFVDLSRQHNAIRGEIVSAIDTAIQQSHFILSGEVAAFEKQFAEYCGTKYCVGISSGTDALQLALRSVSAGSGDSVIVPANTFISTALAVAYTGARPVFVDVEENTYNIDLQKVREAMQKQKIKAIIPVHLYGQPCNMAGLLGIANEYKVDIIEDACQSHGAECLVDKNWIKSGTIGRAGCFSFYPGKNLGALGDAGAVVTNDKSIAEEVYALRDLGQKKKSEHTMLGFNARLDSLQAIVLSIKLHSLDEWNSQRRTAAGIYRKMLSGAGFILPAESEHARHVYHLFVIRTKNRDKLREYLSKNDIGAGIHYPMPLHLSPVFAGLGYKKGDLPVAERLSDEILSLPMFPGITEQEIEYVADALKKYEG